LVGDFDPWLDDPWTYDEAEYSALGIGAAKTRYLDRKRSDGRAENTIRTYREVIELFIEVVGERTILDKVATSEVRTFIRDPSLAKAT
jgi:site-specific recombinase XerD